MELHEFAAKGDSESLAAKLAAGVDVDARDANGKTPLMIAVASDRFGTECVKILIEHGADVNAVTPAKKPIDYSDETRAVLREAGVDLSFLEKPRSVRGIDSVLTIAAKMARPETIRLLIEAGADAKYINPNGYSALIKAVHRPKEAPEVRRSILTMLINAGSPLDAETEYGESVLRSASGLGRFDEVAWFLERGAQPDPLAWSALFHTIAAGDLEQVAALVAAGADIEHRDSWSRTAFLLAVAAGRRDIAQLLWDNGCERNAKGRCGQTALMCAIERDDDEMVRWLVDQGFDVEETDDFGTFPLLYAAHYDAIQCTHVLLKAGASATRRTKDGASLMSEASHPEILSALVAVGGELSDIRSKARPALLRLPSNEVEVTADDFGRYRHRKFGIENPERMNNPLWDSQVHSRASAYTCASAFGYAGNLCEPTWCCYRYGQSLTRLPDDRFVEIGGEHEDYYDPDFCIYNDVIVYDNGSFQIFGYPEMIFPPTDFHSATLVWPYIYIIGNLGYADRRVAGKTPVFRLDCTSWSIKRLNCVGQPPGWIHRHTAKLIDKGRIEVSGGLIDDTTGGELMANASTFSLELGSLVWSKVEA